MSDLLSTPPFFPILLHSLAPPVYLYFRNMNLNPGVGSFVIFHQSLVAGPILYCYMWIFSIMSIVLCSWSTCCCPTSSHIPRISTFCSVSLFKIGSMLSYSSCLNLCFQSSPCFLCPIYISRSFFPLSPTEYKLSCSMSASPLRTMQIPDGHHIEPQFGIPQ